VGGRPDAVPVGARQVLALLASTRPSITEYSSFFLTFVPRIVNSSNRSDAAASMGMGWGLSLIGTATNALLGAGTTP
jgi:hypothetical protein